MIEFVTMIWSQILYTAGTMLLYSSPLWMKSISQIKSIEVFLIRGPQTARLDLK